MASCSKIQKKSETIKIENSIYNEDRLSSLPESLIHHILSFLPSTKDAAKTAILSKSWRYKCHHVPKLIFEGYFKNYGKRFCKLIEKALILYAGSRLETFAIDIQEDLNLDNVKELYLHMSKFIHLATIKAAREVILCVYDSNTVKLGEYQKNFWLPQCFYDNTSLIKLKTCCFNFLPNGRVNWPSLKSLRITCANLTNEIMENILSGSPLLESLGLEACCHDEFNHLHIDSKFLKRLALYSFGSNEENSLEISGPSVEILEILGHFVFRDDIAIDLPSLVSCTIDFDSIYGEKGDDELVQGLVQQAMYATELKLGRWCLQKALSFFEAKAVSDSGSETEEQPSSLSNIQCLIIDGSVFNSFSAYIPGIMSLLRNSPMLEKLVIKLGPTEYDDVYDEFYMRGIDQPDYRNISENCLMSGNTILTCLSSRLKTVEIIGLIADFHNRFGDQYNFAAHFEHVLEFVEFLLKNASVLEKMVIYESRDRRTERTKDFALKVSQRLSRIPRASPHVMIIVPEYIFDNCCLFKLFL